METLFSGYGLMLGSYIFGSIVGLLRARNIFEAHNNEDYLDHDEGMSPFSLKEYRRQQLLGITVFPLIVMITLQILAVPWDRAPGLIPNWIDLLARGITSISAVGFIVFTFLRFFQSIRKHVFNRKFELIRTFLGTGFLILSAFYPWTSETSPWWRIEVLAFCAIAIFAILLRWYE